MKKTDGEKMESGIRDINIKGANDISKMYIPIILAAGIFMLGIGTTYSITTKLNEYSETLKRVASALSSMESRIAQNEELIRSSTDKRYRTTDAERNFTTFCLLLVLENPNLDIQCPDIFSQEKQVFRLRRKG